MNKIKVRSKFISEFFKLAAEGARTGGQILYNIFDTWESIPYKGFRMKERPRYNSSRYRGLYKLQNRKLVKISSIKVSITDKGQIWFKQSYLKHLKELHPKWDKKWRVVIFDIPQELHTNRNRFRRKLKSL